MSSTNQSRLKRRTLHGSSVATSPLSRPGTTSTSDDYDLPPTEPDLGLPVKRSKPQPRPQGGKKPTKMKSQPAITKKKQAGSEGDYINVTTSSKAEKETTVASTRSKQVGKTPVYVEESGDIDQEAQEESHDGEEAINEDKEGQENTEIVEDSHKLNQSAVEEALEAADLSFDSNLREMIAPERKQHKPVDDTQRRASSIKEFSIPSVNEMALRKTPIDVLADTAPKNQPPAEPSVMNGKAFAAGPVRMKRSLLDAIPTQRAEPDHPPPTPTSFCTRLEAENTNLHGMQTTPDEARASVNQDTTYASGNASITLVGENSTLHRRQPFSPSRRRRQQRSISSDLRLTEDSPSLRRQSKDMMDNRKLPAVGIRESQQGLRDSMSQITKVSTSKSLKIFAKLSQDVMFRFGEEEDAIKTKAKEFHAGGNAVLKTLTESWNDRLSHHYRKLRKDLGEEKAVLAKASETLNAAKASQLEILRNGDATLQKIDEKTDTLLVRIAALRCRD